MPASLIEKLRSARKIEYLALAVALALIVLLFSGLMGATDTAQEDASTPLEKRLEGVLSCVEGAGKVRVMVTQDESDQIVGVLVVAEGAGKIEVQLRLAEAVKSLLNVELRRIEVEKMAM